MLTKEYTTNKDTYLINIYYNGIEVVGSYKHFWDASVIKGIMREHQFNRSKFSLYVEWVIHTACYKLGIKKSRAKDVFFEFGTEWFKNLFKK